MKEIKWSEIKVNADDILTHKTLDAAEWDRDHYFPYGEYEVVRISDVSYGLMKSDGHMVTKIDYDKAYVNWMFNTYPRPE